MPISPTVLLARLFEADLADLTAMRDQPLAHPELQAYFEVLLAYWQNDQRQLEQAAMYIDRDRYAEIHALSVLRLQLRREQVTLTSVQQVLSFVGIRNEWDGEHYFVAAMALQQLRMYASARKYFQLAAAALASIGALRKAHNASHNASLLGSQQPDSELAELEPVRASKPRKEKAKRDYAVALTKMEQRLLRVLSEREMCEFELVERLYGANQDYRLAEQRLRSLVQHLSVKQPGLIERRRNRIALTVDQAPATAMPAVAQV